MKITKTNKLKIDSIFISRIIINKLTIFLLLSFSKLAGISFPNPTAPNSYLEYYDGNFSDSDQDGMSDIAEVKYGYDPKDRNSFPKTSYFLDDLGISKLDITDDPKL